MILSGSIKSALNALGVYRHRLSAQPFPGVAVLAYHGVRAAASRAMHFADLHVTADRLDEQCRALRELDCTVLSFADWRAIAAGQRPLPLRAVMITFDDGYRSVLTLGLPVLEKHGMPATVFVCTGAVEHQVRFWFDAVAGRAGEAAVEQAKALPYEEWRELVGAAEHRVNEDDPHAPLTIAGLQQLAAHPLITIGAHTVSHPILANAPPGVQREEVEGSCAALRSWLGRSPHAFAYPNGRPGVDYTSATMRVLEESRIAHAFTTAGAFADPRGAALEHPRFLIVDGVRGVELAHRLAGAWPRVPAGAMA